MRPIETSTNLNEKVVFINLQSKREKHKPQFQLGQSFRTAEFKKTVKNGDSRKWSYKLYKFIEVTYDTIRSELTIYSKHTTRT